MLSDGLENFGETQLLGRERWETSDCGTFTPPLSRGCLSPQGAIRLWLSTMTTTQRAATTTAKQPAFGFTTAGLTATHYGAIGLASVTGLVHLYLYYAQEFLPFLLAGLGFFGAIGLILVLPRYRPWLYLAGIPYTLAQMAGWYLAGMPDFTLGVADKLVQVSLIALLAVLYLRERRD